MSIETIEAEKNKRMIIDPKGFFVIFIDKSRREIVVEFYEGVTKKGGSLKPDTGKLMAVVCGDDAEALCHTIVREDLVSRMEHATYLGSELKKAEVALNLGIKYEQDSKLPLKKSMLKK